MFLFFFFLYFPKVFLVKNVLETKNTFQPSQCLNPLSANFTEWSNTLKQLATSLKRDSHTGAFL